MRFVLTTEAFRYAGRPRPGFPAILGDDMRPAQPFHDYLVWKLLDRGAPYSPLTTEAYGRRLWDFAMFLGANGLSWNHQAPAPGSGVVVRYRDWSAGELKLNAGTVNGRLRLVFDFYRWASKNGLIQELPFTYSLTSANFDKFHRYLGRPEEEYMKSDVALREWSSMPEFLAIEQLRLVRPRLRSSSHWLLFDLMVRVGLRSVEARTFPVKYVFNPATRADCGPGRMISIRLCPLDMQIKYDKPRIVDVPYSLMEDMYAYSIYERNRLLGASADTVRPLVATVRGSTFSKDTVGQVFRVASSKVKFRVTALMLRHSYAVHTLKRLREDKNFKGEPLLYIRDQLGHENVQTTVIYLRQIDKLAGGLVLAMSDEFDRLFETAE